MKLRKKLRDESYRQFRLETKEITADVTKKT
jgi:hypothetical protein